MSAMQDVFHFPPQTTKADDVMRETVRRTEVVICAGLPDPGSFHVEHYFAGGVYGRAIYIPKGCFLTGKIHKYPQINVLVSGHLRVLTHEGMKEVKPPFIIVSPAGTKRIAFAVEDTIWLTLHGTEETDVVKIEQQFIAQNEEEYLRFRRELENKGGPPCLGEQ